MKSIPESAIAYTRTKTFTESTLPSALRGDHRTKDGVWGLLVLEQGTADLVFHDGERITCTPDHPGVIAPQRTHHIEGEGPFELHVAFHK